MSEVFSFQGLIVFLVCYLAGSLPTAYILVKLKSNKDVTKEGSGNVGTLNSFTVSKSKAVGITVLLIDLLKGALPVYIMLFIFPVTYPVVMLGAVGLITGHNYPVWLKFKGGRGLAPGAGIFLVVNYFIVLGWCVLWLLTFVVKRKVLIANTVATFGLPLLVLAVNILSFMEVNKSVPGYSISYFTVFSIIITFVILLRHKEVFKEFSAKKII
jgi:acyl phosphate:glycerol-3-phosphate acyltransferase